MKKRTVISIITVVGLLVIAIVSGGVLAQGIFTNSTADGSDPAPAASVAEAAPGSMAQASGMESWSSSDGSLPNYAAVNIDESEFHFASPSNEAAPSSSSGPSSSPAGLKVEPLMALSENQPNAPTWNSNIRYVGSTLKPRTNTVNYNTNGSGGCVYATGGDALAVWNVPLSLPNGAVIEWLRMYFYDNDTTNNIRGWFTKYDLYGNLVAEWGVWSTSGGNGYADVAISPAETINYDAYSYVLNFRPYVASADLQLCGFRLFYTVYSHAFLPMLTKP